MSILDKFQLAGRAALVTGSSRGIGRAIALGLAECGAAVAVHGMARNQTLSETLAGIQKLSPRSIAVAGDLSQPEVPAGIVAEATTTLGALDIVVINASIQLRRPWAQITPAEAELQMQVNFHASLRLIQAAAPAMQNRRWGRILTVGSVQQACPHPEMAVYAASKSALDNLVRNLAKQLAPDGVTVNNLAPGVILTDRNTAALADGAYAARVRERIPLGEFATPEDCVGTAVLLCSEAGRYLTGQDIFVDGGMSLP